MKITQVLDALALDVGIDPMTLEYCKSRFDAEGFQFLSVTLPAFSKHVIRCLEVGYFNHPSHPETLWSSFKRQDWGRIPLFFKVQLKGLFSNSGRVLANPDPAALASLRQFCEYFYKLATAFTDEEKAAAAKKYLENESQVGVTVDEKRVNYLCKFIRRNYLANLPTYDQITNRHRPRDTSGAFFGSSAHRGTFPGMLRRTVNGTRLLPDVRHAHTGHLIPGPIASKLRWLRQHRVRRESANTCEVLFVPKDSRGPRVISKEPMSYLRFQMSYFDFMVGHLQRVTANRILFDDQQTHRELARKGSLDGSWATMDLKDASDLIPYSVVSNILRNTPLAKFLAFRSSHALVPTVRDPLPLKKLAGMGSGLTFPTLALLIHAAVSYEISLRTRLTERQAMRVVYVYGDDLIVPGNMAHLVGRALTRVGLKLNHDKCFVRGPFRESCGADYLNGVSVSPVRLRLASCDIPNARQLSVRRKIADVRHRVKDYAAAFVQFTKHANELQANGCLNTAELFYRSVEDSCTDKLPFVSAQSPVLGRLGSDMEVLSVPEHVKDHVFIPATASYEALTSSVTNRHDMLFSYVLELRALENRDSSKSCRGLGIPRKGKIRSLPGNHVRRLAPPCDDSTVYIPSSRRFMTTYSSIS